MNDVAGGIEQAAGGAQFDQQSIGMSALRLLNGTVNVLGDQGMNGVINDDLHHVCTA